MVCVYITTTSKANHLKRPKVYRIKLITLLLLPTNNPHNHPPQSILPRLLPLLHPLLLGTASFLPVLIPGHILRGTRDWHRVGVLLFQEVRESGRGRGCRVVVRGLGEWAHGVFAEVGQEGFAEGPVDGVIEGFVEDVGEEGDD